MEEQILNDKIGKVYMLCQLGKAWYKQGEQLFLLSVNKMQPESCQARDIGILYNTDPEVVEKENLTLVEARYELKTCYSRYMALFFAIDGFDTDLIESRRMGIKRANELCEDKEIQKFVSDRLLSCPVPKEADVKGAIEIARQENALFLLGIFGKLSYKRAKKAFLDAASEDRTGILTFKEQHPDLELITVTSVDDPTETFNQLERALDACDEVITFYNEAPLSWLTQRLRHYQRAQSKRKNNLNIHIRSSKPQPKDLKRLPPNAHWENCGLAT